MDLKPGEVSLVLADPSGYVIYKVKSKETLSWIKPGKKSERFCVLGACRTRCSIEDSATPTLDESYFHRSRP